MQKILIGVDALLVSNPTNIRYLTGFVSAAPQEREAYVLVTTNALYLFTNSLYLEQAKKLKISDTQLTIIQISRDYPLTQAINTILKQQYKNKSIRLGIEGNNVTVTEYAQLKNKLENVQLVSTQNRVEEKRITKTPQEITHIRKACQITDLCFTHILQHIKSGISEIALAWEIETYFRESDAQCSFSPIVAYNENSSQPHYAPTNNRKLQKNSLILLDFGARFQGYCADMTRMVYFGNPPEKIRHAYQTLYNAQEKALTLLTQGERSGAQLDTSTRKILVNNSFPEYAHSLGHGVGLDIHEAPRLSMKHDEQLKPGMVFSVEPGIYFEGKFGMRLEDLVWINEKNEIEILSHSNKELNVIK